MKDKISILYFTLSIIFICSGLILVYLYFVVLVPQLSGAGGWIGVIFPIFLSVILLGVLEIMFGFIMLFNKKTYKQTTHYFGVVSLIIGAVFIYLQWWFMWYLIVLLVIIGIVILYLGFKNKFK